MNLFKKDDKPSLWNDFEDAMTSLQKQINSAFGNFLGDSSSLPGKDSWFGGFNPKVNVVEKEKEFRVTAELAGLDEKDVEVTLDNGNLIIKGEKKEQKDEKKEDYRLLESRYGSFRRVLPFGKGIDAEKISAKFNKGVLEVVIPKTAEAQSQAKKINIQS